MVTLSMLSLFLCENWEAFPDRVQIIEKAMTIAGKDGMLTGSTVVELLGQSSADILFKKLSGDRLDLNYLRLMNTPDAIIMRLSDLKTMLDIQT